MVMRPKTCKAQAQGEKTGGAKITCARPANHFGDHRGVLSDGSVFEWSDALQTMQPEEVKFFAAPPHLENVSMCGRCGALVPTFVADNHANWHIHVLKDGDAIEAMNAALSNKDAVSATEVPKSIPNPVAKRRTPETGIA